MRGNRVQAIVRELSNERIDIINWTEELSLLVRRVFSPAEVKRVIPVGLKKIVVVIKEDNLAQAIGKEGQNIRLASKMLEKEIDVYGDEEFGGFTEDKRTELVTEGYIPSAEEEEAVAIEEEKDLGDSGETFVAAQGAAQEDVESGEGKNLNDDEVVQSIVEEAVENVEEPETELGEEDK
jgi:N utilization substance protein A